MPNLLPLILLHLITPYLLAAQQHALHSLPMLHLLFGVSLDEVVVLIDQLHEQALLDLQEALDEAEYLGYGDVDGLVEIQINFERRKLRVQDIKALFELEGEAGLGQDWHRELREAVILDDL